MGREGNYDNYQAGVAEKGVNGSGGDCTGKICKGCKEGKEEGCRDYVPDDAGRDDPGEDR